MLLYENFIDKCSFFVAVSQNALYNRCKIADDIDKEAAREDVINGSV